MKFLDYIKGQRKGKDAHRIEKDSMMDPFLYEAIEGFDSITDNHIERLNDIQKRIKGKSSSKRKNLYTWKSIAATVIVFIAAGTYLLSDFHKSGLYAQEQRIEVIELYVPQTYYKENIVPIAKENAEVSKKIYKPQISKFKPSSKIDPDISEEEAKDLSEKKRESDKEIIIEIYTPAELSK